MIIFLRLLSVLVFLFGALSSTVLGVLGVGSSIGFVGFIGAVGIWMLSVYLSGKHCVWCKKRYQEKDGHGEYCSRKCASEAEYEHG